MMARWRGRVKIFLGAPLLSGLEGGRYDLWLAWSTLSAPDMGRGLGFENYFIGGLAPLVPDTTDALKICADGAGDSKPMAQT